MFLASLLDGMVLQHMLGDPEAGYEQAREHLPQRGVSLSRVPRARRQFPEIEKATRRSRTDSTCRTGGTAGGPRWSFGSHSHARGGLSGKVR